MMSFMESTKQISLVESTKQNEQTKQKEYQKTQRRQWLPEWGRDEGVGDEDERD